MYEHKPEFEILLCWTHCVQVGNYHSTKIWAFTMRHHCGCKITIQTDPKNAEYLVTDGARRKIEQYDAEDAQTIELPDANERAVLSADPLASLERKTIQVKLQHSLDFVLSATMACSFG